MFTNSPSAELRVVEGGQHFLSASNPQDVDQATIEFVDRWNSDATADIRCADCDCPLTVQQHEVAGPEQRHLHVVATRSRNKPIIHPDRKEAPACRTHNRSSQYATRISS